MFLRLHAFPKHLEHKRGFCCLSRPREPGICCMSSDGKCVRQRFSRLKCQCCFTCEWFQVRSKMPRGWTLMVPVVSRDVCLLQTGCSSQRFWLRRQSRVGVRGELVYSLAQRCENRLLQGQKRERDGLGMRQMRRSCNFHQLSWDVHFYWGAVS